MNEPLAVREAPASYQAMLETQRIRPGYKQTEVGVIPKDWEIRPLNKITDANRPISYGIVQTGRPVRNGVKCVRVVDIDRGRVNADDLITTSAEISRAYKRTLLSKGDLVIALRGKIGELALIDEQLAGANLTRGVALIAPLDGYDSEYLLHYLSSPASKQIFEKNLNGSALQEIPIATLRKIPAVTPPFLEQRAIAAVLSDVDALLAKLDQFITKKRDLKQAAMQQLLTGQTRLPGFSGAWEVRPLGYVVANLETGVSVNSVEYDEPLSSGEPCILKTSAIFGGRFDPEECKLIDRRDINRAKLSPRRDTIIISRMNTPNLVGEVGYVQSDFPTLSLPDRLWMTRFYPGVDICPRWLAYVMCSTEVKEAIKGLATGTSGSMKNIAKSALLAMQLAFPSGPEQTAIATVLSDMDAEIAALEARSDKTRALKQGMMQELLTGRIRLV